jgi:ubiquinol-cytochrome c reductase cytochrome b subunit
MANFVTETVKDWSAEDVRNVAIALSFEAGAREQVTQDDVKAGRKLIADTERCAQCHKFHEAGELGSAPDLTGYGSREWLVGMVSNPAHERYYRDDNDRMPAFAEHPDDSPSNRLSAKSIGLIVDWLRGQWYEPAQANEPGSPDPEPPTAGK